MEAIAIALSLVIVILMVVVRKKRYNPILPPGPRKFPIVGNLPQLFGAPPHQRMRDLARVYGPVMSIQQGEVSAVVISSVETAKEVLKNQAEASAGRPFFLSLTLLYYNNMNLSSAPYGDYWRQMRRICTMEFLSLKRVQSFRCVREEQVSEFVRSLAAVGPGLPVNLTNAIRDLTDMVMLITTLGKSGKSKQTVINMLENVKDVIIGGSIVDVFPSLRFLSQYLTGANSRMMRVHRQMDSILEDILTEHKSNQNSQPDNLLQVLLDVQKNHADLSVPLTNESIKATVMEIFLAGSHTTSKIVEWAMAELMKNPETMKKAQMR